MNGWLAAAGGLSVNDFIIAARIDQIKTQDLIPKKRVWA
jgi:4a-hydroxytetrahydrobiopterin dehydratase